MNNVLKSIFGTGLSLVWLLCCNDVNAQITQINTNVTDNLYKILRIGNQTLVTNFSNYVIHSDDDFNTFSLLSTPSTIIGGRKRLKYQNEKLYLLSGSLSPTYSEFWMSTDTGNTWSLMFDTSNLNVIDFTMFDNDNGIMYASQHRKFRTSDGGYTWQYEPSIMYYPYSILMYNDSIGVIPTQSKILLSNDRFVNEVFQSNSEISGAIDGQYLNKDTLVFTSSVNVSGCFLLSSHNGGQLWQTNIINSFDPRGLYFFSYNEGYVVGKGYLPDSSGLQGIIAKTTNMGQSWTLYNTFINEQLNEIEFLNDSIALITGENGTLLKWNKNSAVTSVIDFEQSSELSIYPNPSNSVHTLSYRSVTTNLIPNVELVNMSGRVVGNYKMKPKGDSEYTLTNDLTGLSNGLYMYRIDVNGKSHSLKFVKQ